MTPEEQDTMIEKIRRFSRHQGQGIELGHSRRIHRWLNVSTVLAAILCLGPLPEWVVGQMTGQALWGAGWAFLLMWVVLLVVDWNYQARIGNVLREELSDGNRPRPE